MFVIVIGIQWDVHYVLVRTNDDATPMRVSTADISFDVLRKMVYVLLGMVAIVLVLMTVCWMTLPQRANRMYF